MHVGPTAEDSCRWGVVASVLGASLALALVHSAYDNYLSKSKETSVKKEALPEPQQGPRQAPGKFLPHASSFTDIRNDFTVLMIIFQFQ
jgi:hypothetical protein